MESLTEQMKKSFLADIQAMSKNAEDSQILSYKYEGAIEYAKKKMEALAQLAGQMEAASGESNLTQIVEKEAAKI